MLAGLSGGLAPSMVRGVFGLDSGLLNGVSGFIAPAASFTAALRLIVPLATPHQRAGVVAVIYIVSYVAFGVPIVIAGVLADSVGLVTTVVA